MKEVVAFDSSSKVFILSDQIRIYAINYGKMYRCLLYLEFTNPEHLLDC
jgi:hypothetical protein